jgi:hypothetical protein
MSLASIAQRAMISSVMYRALCTAHSSFFEQDGSDQSDDGVFIGE